AILSRNAVATSGRPHGERLWPISAPSLRSKLVIAMSSQRPATLTQRAMLQLIGQMARKLLAAG
ncbi:MAG TPA: LysR family transcriptional regulator, partial [Ramlibacter sp.]|nr:LysR family transcriptional regulator [Ramlibacter sp.]